jgi:hypothetical protein
MEIAGRVNHRMLARVRHIQTHTKRTAMEEAARRRAVDGAPRGKAQADVQPAPDDAPVANVAQTLAIQWREEESGAGARLWSHVAASCTMASIFAMEASLLQRFHMPGYTV